MHKPSERMYKHLHEGGGEGGEGKDIRYRTLRRFFTTAPSCPSFSVDNVILTSLKISTSSEANSRVSGSRQPSCSAFSPIDFDQHKPLRAAAACW